MMSKLLRFSDTPSPLYSSLESAFILHSTAQLPRRGGYLSRLPPRAPKVQWLSLLTLPTLLGAALQSLETET